VDKSRKRLPEGGPRIVVIATEGKNEDGMERRGVGKGGVKRTVW